MCECTFVLLSLTFFCVFFFYLLLSSYISCTVFYLFAYLAGAMVFISKACAPIFMCSNAVFNWRKTKCMGNTVPFLCLYYLLLHRDKIHLYCDTPSILFIIQRRCLILLVRHNEYLIGYLKSNSTPSNILSNYRLLFAFDGCCLVFCSQTSIHICFFFSINSLQRLVVKKSSITQWDKW